MSVGWSWSLCDLTVIVPLSLAAVAPSCRGLPQYEPATRFTTRTRELDPSSRVGQARPLVFHSCRPRNLRNAALYRRELARQKSLGEMPAQVGSQRGDFRLERIH